MNLKDAYNRFQDRHYDNGEPPTLFEAFQSGVEFQKTNPPEPFDYSGLWNFFPKAKWFTTNKSGTILAWYQEPEISHHYNGWCNGDTVFGAISAPLNWPGSEWRNSKRSRSEGI